MNDLYSINYSDFIGELQTNANHSWGSFQQTCTSFGPIKMYELQADLTKDFKIQIEDESMSDEIHFCATLRGNIRGSFCDNKAEINLNDSQHHHIYAPDEDYELTMRNLHVIHLAINRSYFMDLIDGPEPWMKELRNNLQKQKVVQTGSISLAPEMRTILLELLQPSLSGNLRNLQLEGKVIELIALQLDQHVNASKEQSKWRKKDLETFYAIHEYLSTAYNEDHSLQSLSRQFGINEFKLKQGFRQHFGTTVFDFIFDLKMKHAKKLILEERLYLHEVSRQVGYKNANHFSTAFKRKFGFSPNELRNN